MSDWLDKFKKQKITNEVNNIEVEDSQLAEAEVLEYDDEVEYDGPSEEQSEDAGSMNLENFDMDLDEIVEDISKTNKYVFATLEAMNRELKAGFTLVRSEQAAIADVNEILISLKNIDDRVEALEDKVTRSLLAMEDGNEKRALLLANALEEINDLVADPDGMTDVFKVAPDIAMGAIERESQGELSSDKPFNPDDEIYLPEAPEEEGLTVEEEFLAQIKVAELVDEENPELLTDEGGPGEIQLISVPSELSDYNERDYNAVMDYINGDIKWKDIMKYAGGMKQAKALVDPVKLFHNIQ